MQPLLLVLQHPLLTSAPELAVVLVSRRVVDLSRQSRSFHRWRWLCYQFQCGRFNEHSLEGFLGWNLHLFHRIDDAMDQFRMRQDELLHFLT
ncbi:hypothetical protein D9M68_813970 [compost metagenome]